MERLEERIRRDGAVEDGEMLKVDSFLNHQLDVELFTAMGKEWARLFAGTKIDKILTAVVVGAGVAIEKAFQLGGDRIRAKGVRVEALARIRAMSPGKIEFC